MVEVVVVGDVVVVVGGVVVVVVGTVVVVGRTVVVVAATSTAGRPGPPGGAGQAAARPCRARTAGDRGRSARRCGPAPVTGSVLP